MQRSMMNTKPTVAIGPLLLLTASVPVSTLVVASRIAKAADGVFSTAREGKRRRTKNAEKG
ncbi:hypothetical protein LINPERHAP1_LOCUS3659 [Linum perenne]